MAASPVRPWMVTVPAAESSQSLGTAVPPEVLTTCLTRVRWGATAVLTMVQIASWPVLNVTVPLEPAVTPVHDQAEAV